MTEYIEKIRSICGLINSTPIDDYTTVMEMSVIIVRNFFNARDTFLFTLDDEGVLSCVSHTVKNSNTNGFREYRPIPAYYAVMRNEKAEIAGDDDAELSGYLEIPSLIAPLIANGRPFGIAAINAPSGDTLSGNLSDEISTLFSIVANMMYNSFLFHALRRKESDLLLKNEELSLSLSRQQMLLKELHHRVKNNLQIILSMVNLQLKREKEIPVVEAIKTVSSRIRSISFVHEKLLWEDEVSSIDFLQYLKDFTAELRHSFSTGGRRFSIRVEGDTVHLSLDQAVPCGLIVNEAVINALRHACPPGEARPEISVSMRKSGEGAVRLTISDNGAGIPCGVDLRSCDTLGFLLMHSLATSNLRGTISLSGEAGVRIDVEFPLTAPAK